MDHIILLLFLHPYVRLVPLYTQEEKSPFMNGFVVNKPLPNISNQMQDNIAVLKELKAHRKFDLSAQKVNKSC